MITKKVISFFIIVFALFFIASIGRSVYDLSRTGKQIEKTEKRVADLGSENEKLKNQFEQVKSDQFVENEAREKLNFVKEGEVVVVLPQEPTPDDSQSEKSKKQFTNWQKWLNILLGEKNVN